jgi:hypothetical protein
VPACICADDLSAPLPPADRRRVPPPAVIFPTDADLQLILLELAPTTSISLLRSIDVVLTATGTSSFQRLFLLI